MVQTFTIGEVTIPIKSAILTINKEVIICHHGKETFHLLLV